VAVPKIESDYVSQGEKKERMAGKHRKSRSQPNIKWPPLVIITLFIVMALFISTAFAKVQNQGSNNETTEIEIEASAPGETGEDYVESDPPWIIRVRELKVAQEQERQRLAEEEARAEAARLEQLRQTRLTQQVQGVPSFTREAPLLVGDQSLANTIDLYLLSKGSPMVGHGRAFVSAGKTFGVDPFLVVAISGKESSFGKYNFKPFNAWGWGDSAWKNWEDAIFRYTALLSEEYIKKDLITISLIGPIYCPPNYKSWVFDVTFFYQELTSLEKTLSSTRNDR
jgi:hypothetical protein